MEDYIRASIQTTSPTSQPVAPVNARTREAMEDYIGASIQTTSPTSQPVAPVNARTREAMEDYYTGASMQRTIQRTVYKTDCELACSSQWSSLAVHSSQWTLLEPRPNWSLALLIGFTCKPLHIASRVDFPTRLALIFPVCGENQRILVQAHPAGGGGGLEGLPDPDHAACVCACVRACA